jgi:hypothetical protein
MNALQRLEDAIGGVLERGFARLTRVPLQPVTIARRLEQAMEDGQIIEGERTLVPNQYWTFLHPQDYQALKPLSVTLEADLREHLVERATARGWAFLTRPYVRINPGRDVRRHDVRVITQMIAATPSPPTLAGTQPMTTVSSPPVVSESGEWNGKLRTPDGTVNYPLARFTVDVGRGRKNDIILDDPRVSRHHAQIRRRRRTFMVFDLDSANGTFVNGRPIEEAILSDGDRVSFGGVELVFTMHDA